MEIIDAGKSRAALIPRTYNHAGYPGGIPGSELLGLMREQASQFGATARAGLVEKIERNGELFARIGDEALHARDVVLGAGAVNNPPKTASEILDAALARGLLRY
nr:hypothetical protein [Novosphingobium sp. PhB165]